MHRTQRTRKGKIPPADTVAPECFGSARHVPTPQPRCPQPQLSFTHATSNDSGLAINLLVTCKCSCRKICTMPPESAIGSQGVHLGSSKTVATLRPALAVVGPRGTHPAPAFAARRTRGLGKCSGFCTNPRETTQDTILRLSKDVCNALALCPLPTTQAQSMRRACLPQARYIGAPSRVVQ